MLQPARRPYVCWRCISRSSRHVDTVAASVGHLRSSRPNAQIHQRRWATIRNIHPTANLLGRDKTRKALSSDDARNSIPREERELSIREQLHLWTAETERKSALAIPADASIYGRVSNSLSRSHSTGSSELDQLKSLETGMSNDSSNQLANGDTEVNLVGNDSRSPGDLVELRQSGSRISVLAIYLGFFGDRNHFYASNGKWVTSIGFSPLFTVPNFITLAELDPVVAKIPKNATPEKFDQLRHDEQGPSRADGAILINKMTEFRNRAESTYQSNLAKLDGAKALLSDHRRVTYLSLFEIADVLLPSSLKEGQNFPPSALYAVHTVLLRNEVGFCAISPSSDCHRRDHLFEILPHHLSTVANKIAFMVREFTDISAKRLRPLTTSDLEQTALGRFILPAREAVSISRQHRDWTSHGILTTSSGVTLPKTEWTQPSKDVITFLEWWASYNFFDGSSRFHAYGALILRALNLYDETALDQSTAWVFLQEIGVISPWEIPSRYRVRFPETTIKRGAGLVREVPKHIEESKRPDIAAEVRTTRDQSAVFCIDAPSTTLIDDGVSLERTDKPDEFWIHIHTADPASSIKPNSDLCRFMELIPENIYLPGHFQAMLPSDIGHEGGKDSSSESLVKQFSLQSGGPALTFSAKISSDGEMLDYKIEPSTLSSVSYLDPIDVAEFCKEPPPPPPAVASHSLTVGKPPSNDPPPPTRRMTPTSELEEPVKDDLLVLYRLAEAIRARRLAKGAWPYFFPRSSVSVSFHPETTSEPESDDLITIPADPYIKIGDESSTGCSVVSNTMVLAGEIAARWCSSRGISIPYRRDAKSEANFSEALAYATDTVYPQIKKGLEPTMGQRQELAKLTGSIELASRPGPYFLLGLDMYAKATSPLRRFSDLIVHWQIHAALAHEREVKRRIDPSTDDLDTILPFTTAQLAQTLPLLQMREKMARVVSRGSLEWILIALVRAWKFENSAPRFFRFTVESRWRQAVLGELDYFKLNATMGIAELDGCRLIQDIEVGDQFEVELADVNVHSRQIVVKAVKYLGKGGGNKGPAGLASGSATTMTEATKQTDQPQSPDHPTSAAP